MYIVLWHCQMKRKVWQLLVAMISIPGVYVYGQKYWGRFQGRLHYATTTTKWRRYCLRPGTLSISMVINMTFFYFNISILKYYECSWNKPCLNPWCFYYKWRKIILSAWIYITLGFTIILTLKVILFSSYLLLCLLLLLLFFLSAVVAATWSNLVAYLWHSLTFVLVDVGEWCRRAAPESAGGRGLRVNSNRLVSRGGPRPSSPASLQDCYRFT